MAPAAKAPIHVVAGVLRDVRGRILLARRTAGRDLAGAWEFPGGKLEAGETPFQALDRELHEELGIRIHSMERLISVPQAYHDKRIVLDVYRVANFSGKPHGREKQALAWAPCEKLSTYPMPPADRPVVAVLTQPSQYLLTPPSVDDAPLFLAQLERALAAGISRVQLRVDPAPGLDIGQLAGAARQLCDRAGAELLINSDIELARRLRCGVHLPARQLMALDRRPFAAGIAVAASCHDAVELGHAQSIGVDFVVLGPVAATSSHPERQPMGWKQFAKLREGVSLPIYALGGMALADHDLARANGAQGIAAIRGLWPA